MISENVGYIRFFNIKGYYLEKNNDCNNSPFTGKGWLRSLITT